jgi:hypothetical protein
MGRALTPRNLKAGFKTSGLFPFNLDRVLTDMPKPPAELTVPKTDEVKGLVRKTKCSSRQ